MKKEIRIYVFILLSVSLMSCVGVVNEIDLTETETETDKKANTGDKNAQYQLGAAYDYGRAKNQNIGEAEKWYRLSAKQGHAEAQNSLESLYQAGASVEKIIILL